MTNLEKIKYHSVTIVLATIGMYFFYNSIAISLILAPVLSYALKKTYINYLKDKRIELVKSQFIELLQSLSASISAGRHMGDALEEGWLVLSSSYAADSPLILELGYMIKSIKESREEEEVVLKNFAKRVPFRDVSNFVDVFTICKETGGDMEKAIIKTSKIIAEKLSMEKEMKVLSAQKKFEGKLISVMPILVIIFLKITSPSYLEPLYSTITGRIVMSFSLIGMGYAYYLIEKITKVNI
jgi:tight adherence protein B